MFEWGEGNYVTIEGTYNIFMQCLDGTLQK